MAGVIVSENETVLCILAVIRIHQPVSGTSGLIKIFAEMQRRAVDKEQCAAASACTLRPSGYTPHLCLPSLQRPSRCKIFGGDTVFLFKGKQTLHSHAARKFQPGYLAVNSGPDQRQDIKCFPGGFNRDSCHNSLL